MTHSPAPRWDAAQYLRHEGHRTRPFHDLLARIDPPAAPARIADLGCGAGNATALLAARWPHARITGFDNSPEMLAKAQSHATACLDFAHADAATWAPAASGTYDLIVSSALLQWVPGHPALIPGWLDALTPRGTFALQVPGNYDAPSHTLLARLRESKRWRGRLSGVGDRTAAVPTPAEYLALLTAHGCEADVWETTYLQLLPGADPVLDWVKGTALRPVLTALADDEEATAAFTAEYAALLRRAYPPAPPGTVFPFRRVFAVGVRR
ncbi:trans-aconitate 2-methyltransferase [Streptomyces candidus]|uniref:Trans-aconitate 2-methyltransferase n=1 Tax=Streptomyces candidus TaxID=67283 RepID=A0A7X0LNG0_9ACTN|nr:trans-aconitate 2-methyltransferase [Streptomyces candidus]MBB6435433.1 trans-aconitate 2-methyltransferase [Streptomyces candidus]GHH47499.1 trans-aconitate 2-methyltransferase [Streptomyces candidus]